MADGYAQASGNLAVLNLHVAPGLGNAMGMLYGRQVGGQDWFRNNISRSCWPA